MFPKVDVNGADTDPLFAVLKKQAPGFLGTGGMKWNFTKFLLDRGGQAVERYAPTTKLKAIEADITKLL